MLCGMMLGPAAGTMHQTHNSAAFPCKTPHMTMQAPDAKCLRVAGRCAVSCARAMLSHAHHRMEISTHTFTRQPHAYGCSRLCFWTAARSLTSSCWQACASCVSSSFNDPKKYVTCGPCACPACGVKAPTTSTSVPLYLTLVSLTLPNPANHINMLPCGT